MTQTDFNTRYGDPTPITGEVLERLGFVRDEYGWHRIASTCGTLEIHVGAWHAVFKDPQRRLVSIRCPRTVGDLLRLCDSLGVTVREGV